MRTRRAPRSARRRAGVGQLAVWAAFAAVTPLLALVAFRGVLTATIRRGTLTRARHVKATKADAEVTLQGIRSSSASAPLQLRSGELHRRGVEGDASALDALAHGSPNPANAVRNTALGAYGLDIAGLTDAEEWMQPLPDSAPSLRVETAREASPGSQRSWLNAAAADLRLLGGGRLRMRRGDDRARFSFPERPRDEDLLHPYLAPAAALAHLWTGSEALHGGAFAAANGAVVLLAEKDGGKSTTLAWLAGEHRIPVLSDDLVVLREGMVLNGPRCLDLRRSSAFQSLSVRVVRPVRNTQRLRVTLPVGPDEASLIATVVLRWGGRTRLETPAPADRLRELLPHRMYRHRLTGDPAALLELAARPMLILTRPRGRAGLRDAANVLRDYFC